MAKFGPEDTKNLVLEFITDLGNEVQAFKGSEEQGDLASVSFFFNRMHPDMIVHHLVTKVLPHKKNIKNRNEKFFLQNTTIFAGLPQDRIDYYSTVLTTKGKVTQEDKDMIWDYFDTFIELAEHNKKNK